MNFLITKCTYLLLFIVKFKKCDALVCFCFFAKCSIMSHKLCISDRKQMILSCQSIQSEVEQCLAFTS